jgi:hypothetical protein
LDAQLNGIRTSEPFDLERATRELGTREASRTTYDPTPVSRPNVGPISSSPQDLQAIPHPSRWGKRYAWLELPEPYEGFQMRIWVNYPNKLDQDIAAGGDSRRNALKAIFVQHNNWPDIEDETKLLEQPSEDAFWNKIPNELLGILIAGLNLEVSRIPKLMVQNANK